MKLPQFSHLLSAAAVAMALCIPSVAQAQPDPDNAPKAENPDNRAPRGPRGRMTPEEREAMMARFIKMQVERAGVTDEKQQDAALEYIQDEADARDDLQEESRTLGTALRNKTLTDAQVAGLLNTYMVAVEDDRTRRLAAQKKLGETLDILQFPRLEAMLTLMGAWGDAPNMGGNAFMGRGRDRGDRGNRGNRGNRGDNADEKKPAAKPEKKAKAGG